MSTKIYTAWRMSPRVFERDFLPAFHQTAVALAVKLLRPAIPPEPTPEQVGTVFHRAILASRSPYRAEPSLIDASLNAWLHKGKFYVIPYSEFLYAVDFDPPAGVEEYRYWNNTDRPRELSNRQWQARRRTWDSVCLDDWDSSRLTHQVISAKDGIGLIAVARRLLNGNNDMAHRAVHAARMMSLSPVEEAKP